VAVAGAAFGGKVTVAQFRGVDVPPAGVALKLTVPVGVAFPAVKAGVTVAVKVTEALTAEGLAEDATVVVVPVVLTIWLKDGEVEALKFVSPPYAAVIVCVPCVMSGTVQGGTLPFLNGAATVPVNRQFVSWTPLSK
jgi:hypothetical protein